MRLQLAKKGAAICYATIQSSWPDCIVEITKDIPLGGHQWINPLTATSGPNLGDFEISRAISSRLTISHTFSARPTARLSPSAGYARAFSNVLQWRGRPAGRLAGWPIGQLSSCYSLCAKPRPRDPVCRATRRALLIGEMVSAYHGSTDKTAEWRSLIEPEVETAFRSKVVTCVAIDSHDLLIAKILKCIADFGCELNIYFK